jgi:hypothetical protein
VVKKPGGGWRFCVDYRQLNARSVVDPFPMPDIEEHVLRLKGAKIFSTIDLFSSFTQVRMDPESIPLTGFNCRYGSFEWKVLPFGLTGGPATMSRTMVKVLSDLIDKVFFASLMIY